MAARTRSWDAGGVAKELRNLMLGSRTVTKWGGDIIESSEITGRVLQLIIPKGSMNQVQRAALDAARERASKAGINLTIIEF